MYWHWSKNYGFKINHRITGFDETMITYVLAASSPTFPIERSVYEKCYKVSNYYYNGKSYYGIKLDLGMEYGGPLFFTHYSFLGLNPNGLSDNTTNYFDRNRAHALIQLAYATENLKKHIGYGANCWGFTASDDALVGYTTHDLGTKDENGTISPTAAISSIVYTPKESLAALRHFYYDKGNMLFGKYGFYDAFNEGMVEGQQVVHTYLAIDQGPIAVMIENYRSGLLWKLFMSNPEIHIGLDKLGFKTKVK
ncbi:MAG: glucoamylase family protein [Paludibacter sp.]